jgi:hypothetical protein
VKSARLVALFACVALGGSACAPGAIDLEPERDVEREGVEKPLDPDSPAWQSAEVIHVPRSRPDCDVRRHGEQIRVFCAKLAGNVFEQLAGDPTLVRYGKRRDLEGFTPAVTFPLRRGDKRVFQASDFEANRWAWGVFPQLTISAYWPVDAAEPTIVLR